MKKLYGIGTGPGAADLLTIRAVNVIKDTCVIFAPNNKGLNMALDTAKEYVHDKRKVLIDFPMGNVTIEDYKSAADIIYKEIPNNGSGAFLTIGDPMIYSTFIYIMNELKDMDIEVEIVSGIPSFVAAAGVSQIPLTVKGDTFLLCDEYSDESLANISSLAILKTFKRKEQLLDKLEEKKFSYTYVKRASLANEEILNDRASILEDRDYIWLILGRKVEDTYEE